MTTPRTQWDAIRERDAALGDQHCADQAHGWCRACRDRRWLLQRVIEARELLTEFRRWHYHGQYRAEDCEECTGTERWLAALTQPEEPTP